MGNSDVASARFIFLMQAKLRCRRNKTKKIKEYENICLLRSSHSFKEQCLMVAQQIFPTGIKFSVFVCKCRLDEKYWMNFKYNKEIIGG